MKIIYWGNVKDVPHPTQEEEILKALRKVAEVKFFDIKRFDMKKLLKEAENADVFLFHGQVPTSDEVTAMLMVERIQVVLRYVKCKKVLWFMEKVWLGKGNVVEKLLPEVDYAFFTDETWVRRIKEDIYPLHPAAPVKPLKGTFRSELACDIAYVGNVYGPRQEEYDRLKEMFGDSIKFFDNKFGQDLADLCVSAKVMLVPRFPFDDFYWSSRVYTYLANKAFVVQQRTHGLREEGFVDGKHYFEYETESEFVGLMESVLDKNSDKLRKEVAKQGKEFVKSNTYEERIKEMLKIVQ